MSEIPLLTRVIIRSVWGMAAFIALIFGPVGTFDYWQGWVFLAVFTAATTGFTVYLTIYDRPLLERRMKVGPWAETEPAQKIIVSLVFAGFFALLVVPALDFRAGWSPVPAYVSLLGDAFVLFSFLFIFWVLRVNSYAASTIQVSADQRVIDSGPYAFVRHPMYAGAVWLLIGMPLALGSWWSLALVVPFLPVLMWRLTDEERFLRAHLAGYADYAHRVRHRLIPFVW